MSSSPQAGAAPRTKIPMPVYIAIVILIGVVVIALVMRSRSKCKSDADCQHICDPKDPNCRATCDKGTCKKIVVKPNA